MMNFAQLTDHTAHLAGHRWTVLASFLLVVLWALVGPFYEWSEGHQLVINTVTTIITFWLVFIIQATQNRDTLAMHAKLDELIRSSNARNEFIGIDDKDEDEVKEMRGT